MSVKDTVAVPESPPLVTIEMKVNGRQVKRFPYRLYQNKIEVTPDQALILVSMFQAMADDRHVTGYTTAPQ